MGGGIEGSHRGGIPLATRGHIAGRAMVAARRLAAHSRRRAGTSEISKAARHGAGGRTRHDGASTGKSAGHRADAGLVTHQCTGSPGAGSRAVETSFVARALNSTPPMASKKTQADRGSPILPSWLFSGLFGTFLGL